MWDRFVVRRKLNSLSRRLNWGWAPALPIQAWIATTDRCNLRCRTCWHGYCPPEAYHDMKPEVFEQVRRQLLPGLQNVSLSGGGEPFLSPAFYTILDEVLGPNRSVVVVTNGTIVRPDALEQIVRSPSELRVSIDGAANETMKRIRGISLDRVVEFLDTVKRIMDRCAHPRFFFSLSFVITRSNLLELSDVVELGHRYGIKGIGFNNFEPFGRTDEFVRQESLMSRPDLVLPHWNRARDRAVELGMVVPQIYFSAAGPAPLEKAAVQPTVYRSDGRIRQCPAPWWRTYISPDGTVTPCCIWPTTHSLGNILERPFREIWNGEQYRALRRTVNTPHMPELCRNCFIDIRI
jgi:radical SAM protein with 4Fe4S-binding SPASM domain